MNFSRPAILSAALGLSALVGTVCAAPACSVTITGDPVADGGGADAGQSATDAGGVNADGSLGDAGLLGDGASAQDGALAQDGSLGDASDGGSPCAVPASAGRGVITTLYAGPVAVAAVGAQCGTLYLSSAGGAGVQPWKTGTLSSCVAGSCAATVAVVPSFGLHFPAHFTASGGQLWVYGASQPFSAMVGPLDTPGDVLEIAGAQPPMNLGPILDPLQGAAASFGSVAVRGGRVVADVRTYHNHGNYRMVTTVVDVAGVPTMKVLEAGGEVSGFALDATSSRLFAMGQGFGAGIILVDPVTATAAPLWGSTRLYFGFLNGERPMAVAYGSDPASTPTQATCESDTTCAAPTLIANPSLPTSNYLGAFDGTLIWQQASMLPGKSDLVACSLNTWASAACVPVTLATVDTPESPLQANGHNVVFAAGGQVVSVGL